MINVNYGNFFKVEVLHKYFANSICNDFTITPSAQTQAALNGNKVLSKQYGNILYNSLQVDNAGKALSVPAVNLQLTFFLQLNNSLFFNYTNLPSAFQTGKIYYFTNKNNNISNGKNFISQFLAYSNATTYHPGDTATDGSGVVFECISSCKNIPPSTANSTNWMIIDSNQYTSESDALQWMPSVSTYTFTTAQSNAVVDVWAFDTDTKKFTNHILSETISFVQPVTNFKLNLSALSPGKYKLMVNGEIQWVYINDELTARSVFAVVEIFNDENLAADYQLLNGDILNAPLYTINFLNRSTIWKYVLNAKSKGNISLSPPVYNFTATAANTIFSLSPIPLSETPLNVNLDLSTVNDVPLNPVVNVADIACPAPQILINHINGSDKYACSEIFLNY